MNREAELESKLKIISEGIKNLKGVRLDKKSIRQAILQGILSMGNSRVGEGLLYHLNQGLPFAKAWQKAGIDVDRFIFEQKDLDTFFPWDIIETKVSKDLLIREYKKSKIWALQER